MRNTTSINYDSFEDFGREVKSTLDNLESNKDTLDNLVTEIIEYYWTGDAAEGFKGKYDSVDDFLRKFIDNANDILVGLLPEYGRKLSDLEDGAATASMLVNYDELKSLCEELNKTSERLEEVLGNVSNTLSNLSNSSSSFGSVSSSAERWSQIVEKEKNAVNYYSDNLYNMIYNKNEQIEEVNTSYTKSIGESIQNFNSAMNSSLNS